MGPRRTAAFAFRLALLTVHAAACGPVRDGGAVIEDVPLTGASLRRGKTVYDAHCYSCHAQGEGGLGPALNNKPLPAFLIRFQVRHGLGAMPAFPESAIPDDELEDLAGYVIALREFR